MAGPIQSEINNALGMLATGAGAYKHFVNQKQQAEMQETQSRIEHGDAHQKALGKQMQKVRRDFLKDPQNRLNDIISGDYYNKYAAEQLSKWYAKNPSRAAERDFAEGRIDYKEFIKGYNSGRITEIATKTYPTKASKFKPGSTEVLEDDE